MNRILLWLLAAAGSLPGQATFSEWTIPTPNSQPHCVVSDSRGRIWYAAIGVNQIGVFDPATRQFHEFPLPTPNAGPHGIAVGPGDSIWFTEQRANKIARLDPDTFQITEFAVPTPNSSPHTPIYDGRGSIWFTQQTGNRIGRLNIASGQVEEFVIPTPNSGPYGIVADAEGNAWFCSFGGGSNRIGRVDAQTGRITEFRTPTADSGPRRPWIDSKGRIWITENRGNKLAMFDPATEQFKEWDTPTRNGQPYGVVVDLNDRVWYNEFAANTMVEFDPIAEKFTVFPFPGARSSVRIVAVDPFNRIWYGENGNSRIGVVPPAHSVLNAASFRTNSSIAPGAMVAIFGSNLASGLQSASTVPLPTTLLDTSVTFNDLPAGLFFVSGGQINAQVPSGLAGGTAAMQVRRGSTVVLSQSLPVATASPGIFTVNQQGTGAGIVVHADSFRLVSDSEPARPGEFLAVFCTGLGQGAEVTIGGRPAVVSYSGPAPGFVALHQVNVQVPADVPAGVQPLKLVSDGVSSNTVTIAVRGGN